MQARMERRHPLPHATASQEQDRERWGQSSHAAAAAAIYHLAPLPPPGAAVPQPVTHAAPWASDGQRATGQV